MRLKQLSIAVGLLATAVANAATGPSSSATPYLVPSADGVEFTSILTVGDSVRLQGSTTESYRLAGIPDGLGVFKDARGYLNVLVSHEFTSAVGATRAHGSTGAFVSAWRIRPADLRVRSGRDLITTVKLWDSIERKFVTTPNVAFNRFCSSDLPAPSAFFDSTTGTGYDGGRLFLNGEETTGGRAFAHIASGRGTGTTYELPRIGRASWENIVASPFEQEKTVVAALDDGSVNASKVVIYVGTKRTTGTPVARAGLTNGISAEVLLDGFATESGTVDAPAVIPDGYTGDFSLVATGSGTGLNRVEDGAWDPVDPNRFYFVTTASFTANSRLWRLTFDDISQPELGGTIEVLVDGGTGTGPKMMDNLTVDSAGDVYIQEDVGNQTHLGRIFKYEPATDTLTQLAEHDPERFIAGAVADIDGTDAKQSDEESSGIVEITSLVDGETGYDVENFRYFLLDSQGHYGTVNGVALDPELVEGGQLLMMTVPR